MTTTATQKHLSKDIVFHAAVLLMSTNGQTSSLEVKEHLRGLGYWAKQGPISSFLQELQTEHTWIKNDGGGHLVYSLTAAAVSNNAALNTVSAQLVDDIIEVIADSANLDADDIDSDSILSVGLGLDHLDLIQLQIALDGKYTIETGKSDWSNINTVEDVAKLVESLVLGSTNTASTSTTTTTSNAPKARKAVIIINDSVNPSTNPRVKINIDYKKIVTGTQDAKAQCDQKDWYVTNEGNDPVIYDQKYTSDNVRTVYARLKGIKIQKVRASRIEHL